MSETDAAPSALPADAPGPPVAPPPGFHARYQDLLDYFGHHVTTHYFNSAEHSITVVLYEAVVIRFFNVTGELSAVRLLESGDGESVGPQHPFAATGEAAPPAELFAMVDAYCRASLPAEFLARVDVAVDSDTAFYGERSGRPPAPTVPVDDLLGLVEGYFGSAISGAARVSGSRQISCLLYDTFDVTFGYDERMSIFHAAVTLDAGHVSQKFLGQSVSMNSDRQTILESLARVDEYCRLRLALPPAER